MTPTTLRFAPRVLRLALDPQLIRAQLEGAPLEDRQVAPGTSPGAAAALRDDISTDEISPLPAMVHFDERLGRYPYTGLVTGGEHPVGVDAVRRAGIEVVVAGKRYGKGSSREHSVVAERSAGVRLVVAESFERIYRQNADNLGLYTSTDFGLVDRIARGETIGVDEILAGRDPLAAAIVRAGGLLAYGRSRLGDARPAALPEGESLGKGAASPEGAAVPERAALADDAARAQGAAPRPRTLFEKIVQRHALETADAPALRHTGDTGFVCADWRFIHEYYTGMCAHMLDAAFGPALALKDPASIIAFEDHLSYVHRSPVHVGRGLVGDVLGMSRAHRAFVARHGLRHEGYLQARLEAGDPGNTGSEGISHALMAERYALPGQLVVGTDSHTPHSGALGCVAFGVGTTDMANAFVTGAVRFTLAPVLRIECVGALASGVTAKDLVLHLLALPALRAGAGVGKVFEFGGPAIERLGTDERATLTNMTAELGGLTGIVAPDAETVRFLKERRGIDFALEPWMTSDADATYDAVIEVDVSTLGPRVARPGDPGDGLALADIEAPVAIDIAYGGSCTAGKREDFDQYHAVLAWAAGKGLKVPARVRLYLQFGTVDVRDYCVARGYLDAFAAVGAELLQPACGACANCGPGASTEATQVTVSAINRNFPGRSGPGQVWLASPPTVAASAIAGELISFADLQARHAAD